MKKEEEVYLQMIRDYASKGFSNLNAIISEQITDEALQGYVLFSVMIRMFLISQESWKQTNKNTTVFKRLVAEQQKDIAKQFKSKRRKK